MKIDNSIKATLLLCTHFNKDEVKEFKPLTPIEYGRFALWLNENSLNPADLFTKKDEILTLWEDPKKKIDTDRVNALFSRGRSMGIALEKWQRAGIWIISRAQTSYPKALKEKLKQASPAILFGIGNQALLNTNGIGFVGSRSINKNDENFTTEKSEIAIKQGFSVISGGAKGIDQTSMLGALNVGGDVVGVLADNLLKASLSRTYRQYLIANKLVLISPFYPEAEFNKFNAMARNKYIYALSKSVVVAKSDFEKGGTWSGAIEALKKKWADILVRNTGKKGNKSLISLGAYSIDDEFNNFKQDFSVYREDLFQDFNEPLDDKLKDEENSDKTLSLENYGSLLNLFYQDIVISCQENNNVSLVQLKKNYPELSSRAITNWLKLLTDNSLLEREGKQHIYSVTIQSNSE